MLTVYVLTTDKLQNRDAEAEALIKRMSDGDVSAMGGLYELIKTDIFAYALSKTANRSDAEDVTHDTFVQIWKYAAQYKPCGKPLAWIFTVEINIIRKRFNKSKNLVQLDETFETRSDDRDFAEDVVRSELLRRALLILSEDEMEIISLHIVSGLKHREIAQLLERPLSTVLSKYNRAIKKLQVEIKEE